MILEEVTGASDSTCRISDDTVKNHLFVILSENLDTDTNIGMMESANG